MHKNLQTARLYRVLWEPSVLVAPATNGDALACSIPVCVVAEVIHVRVPKWQLDGLGATIIADAQGLSTKY